MLLTLRVILVDEPLPHYMKQMTIPAESAEHLRLAIAEYDLLEAALPEDSLWSTEDYAELQQICTKLVRIIRPFSTSISNEIA
ncbi:hypothetical protein HHL22_11275 [Hymenobacter sp. RP-2-7]|uniref:Uncharacterized protein n=1 Tax=Hymenobacter polaris TaxID=2682546 RepID=A0A7Y0AEA0_9BACT|nr:hypothetical protein [Hymenobacter polaris]NML65786.1 hypothetical protein [Hymenobacter polaris]